jgi:acetyl-CoA carboxylase biotin carboxyl carrier protein
MNAAENSPHHDGARENGARENGELAAGLLRQLNDAACELVANVQGPLRRLRLNSGEMAVELEWSGPAPLTVPLAVPPAPADQALAKPDPAEPPGPDERSLARSPMVGTFYCAPAPGEPPFVSVGSTVEPDTVICIVEAMKLMNQITAERAGVVRDVLVSDGQPVEFDQPLMVIDLLEQDGGG